ncbi:MAG: M28 family peptidase [Bacteroidota bacterium]
MKKFVCVFLLIVSLFSFGQKNLDKDQLGQIIQEINQDSIESYMRQLEAFGTRYTFAENRKEVALWIKQKFESFGYEDVFLDSLLAVSINSGEEKMIYNVICRSNNVYNSGDYGMIGAHHDATTYNHSTVMDTAPGADDNASGTAGVLEIARVFKQNYDAVLPLHFATWTGEETGILGSESYVERYKLMDSLPLFYINLDMIANQTSSTPQMNYYYDDIFSYTYTYIEKYTDIVIHHKTAAAGDNWPFEEEGIPIVYFQEFDFSEQYHQTNDIVDSCEMPFAHKMVQGAFAVTWNMCGAYPVSEFTGVSLAGNGTDFTVRWAPVDNVAYYQIKVYQDEQLLLSENTVEDTLHITEMPLNSKVKVTLQKTTNDSVRGFIHEKIIELNDQPGVFEMSANMDLNNIHMEWSGEVHEDLTEMILQRRANDTSAWETIESLGVSSVEYEITNHPTGLWEYALLVKDTDGNETRSETCMVYATETKDDIMVVSGNLGGYANPSNADVLEFYENILPQDNYYLFSAITEKQYLPIMQNMKVVIWNTFSSNYSRFYENLDLIQSYIENGGKMVFFGKNPQLHIEPGHPEGEPFDAESWVYNLGITNVLENDGAQLKQISHSSGINANVDPDKILANFEGLLPNVDVLVPNANASVVLTYQSNTETSPDNNFDNEPIAIKYKNGNSIFLICGVPLYYFDTTQSGALLDLILNEEMIVGNVQVHDIKSQLEIYPNPAKRSFFIKNTTGERITGPLSLMDMSGRLMNRINIDIEAGDAVEVSPNLPSGIYFLSNDQLSIKQKLIIQY